MTVVATDAWIEADPTACDVCGGSESCEEHLPVLTTAGGGPTFLSAADVIAQPAPMEVVEGFAWVGCVTLEVAESGGGKTFVNLSQAAAVSDGLLWLGRKTVAGSVAYFSFEGDALSSRLAALREAQGHRLEHVYILHGSEAISPLQSRDGETPSPGERHYIEELTRLSTTLAGSRRPPVRLVYIDTARASLSGNEDGSDDVAAYLRSVRRLLKTVPTAAGVITHHSGWQDGEQQRKRERGSSAWRGNTDAVFYLEAGEYDNERGEAQLTLKALKVRDAERPAPLRMIRRRVELLRRNQYGEPVTSCVIELDRQSRADREAEQAQALNAEALALDTSVIKTIVARPELATSQDRLRLALGVRKTAVGESITRIVRNGWALPGRRGEPYTVTSTGLLMAGLEPQK